MAPTRKRTKVCVPFDPATPEPCAPKRVRRESNAFWRFSLTVYRLPGVEAALLALQDRCGTDTNLLLYCCWLASVGRSPDRRSLRRAMAAVARWQAEAIQPMRRARRTVKATGAELPPGWAADLRQRLGRLELDLEYLEQHTLFGLAQQLPPSHRTLASRAAAQASITRYLGLLGLAPEAAVRAELTCLLDACRLQPGLQRR